MQQFASDTPKTQRLAERIRQMLGKAIVGQQTVIEQLLVAVLARGHVLMEGVPGVAKTLLVRALARCLDLDFGRVQLTPDLMPSDILGTYVFDFTTQEFHLRRGPVFLLHSVALEEDLRNHLHPSFLPFKGRSSCVPGSEIDHRYGAREFDRDLRTKPRRRRSGSQRFSDRFGTPVPLEISS